MIDSQKNFNTVVFYSKMGGRRCYWHDLSESIKNVVGNHCSLTFRLSSNTCTTRASLMSRSHSHLHIHLFWVLSQRFSSKRDCFSNFWPSHSSCQKTMTGSYWQLACGKLFSPVKRLCKNSSNITAVPIIKAHNLQNDRKKCRALKWIITDHQKENFQLHNTQPLHPHVSERFKQRNMTQWALLLFNEMQITSRIFWSLADFRSSHTSSSNILDSKDQWE